MIEKNVNGYKLVSKYDFGEGKILSKKRVDEMVNRIVKSLTEEKLDFHTTASGNCIVIGLWGKLEEDGTREIEIYVAERYKHFVYSK